MYCMLKLRNNTIEAVQGISDELYSRIVTSYDNCELIRNLENEMFLAEDSFSRFENWCAAANDAGEFLSSNLRSSEMYCRDFLTAFRSYVDHAKTMITQKYTKQSAQYQNLIQLLESFVCNHSSYAFVSTLRNYAQHCQTVVHGFRNVDAHGIRPVAIKSRLLEEYVKWGDENRRYIRSFEESLDLRSECQSALYALCDIHLQLINELLDLDNRRNDIEFLAEFARDGYGEENIFNFHLAKMIGINKEPISVEEFHQGKGDSFECVAIDWKIVFSIHDRISRA